MIKTEEANPAINHIQCNHNIDDLLKKVAKRNNASLEARDLLLDAEVALKNGSYEVVAEFIDRAYMHLFNASN